MIDVVGEGKKAHLNSMKGFFLWKNIQIEFFIGIIFHNLKQESCIKYIIFFGLLQN